MCIRDSIKVDYTQQKKLAAAVSRVASNINQICRRINSSGHLYACLLYTSWSILKYKVTFISFLVFLLFFLR